jgi:hypothetical protein
VTLIGTNIDDEKYGFIISKLPNIANISLWHNERSVLFHTGMETLDTIKHIEGCFDEMEVVLHKCKNTTKFTLYCFRFLMLADSRDLSLFTAFEALRALEVLDLRLNASQWMAILRAIGHRLRDLKLIACKLVNLQDIVTLCPSLVNLSLVRSEVMQPNTPFNPQLAHFRNLINLKVKCTFGHPVDFRYIRYYVNLETMHLSAVNIFTVEFLTEIMSLGTFKQLKVFRVMESVPGAINMAALKLLIGHCPLLKSIAGLSHCPNLNRRLIDELKDEILEQNFDLLIED